MMSAPSHAPHMDCGTGVTVKLIGGSESTTGPAGNEAQVPCRPMKLPYVPAQRPVMVTVPVAEAVAYTGGCGTPPNS